jgi:G3E family GTPase
VTLVSSEALASLLTLVKQDSHDETSTKRHRKLVQKLANAAKISFAQQALNQDQIWLLPKTNNEARTRRKTKSEILGRGKARVISYEDIEAARAKRAKQEANKEAQGKRKRDRPKRIAVEAVVEEVEATADNGACKKAKRTAQEAKEALALQVSVSHIAEESAPRLYRAPVARMW